MSWQVPVQLVVWKGSLPVLDTDPQQDASTSGSIYYCSPASGREGRKEWGLAHCQGSLAGLRDRGNGFPSSQPSAPAESCTETAPFAGLSQLCNTVVDIRDSFRHYCYQCYIASISTSQTTLNHDSFKNQRYSEREKL